VSDVSGEDWEIINPFPAEGSFCCQGHYAAGAIASKKSLAGGLNQL